VRGCAVCVAGGGDVKNKNETKNHSKQTQF